MLSRLCCIFVYDQNIEKEKEIYISTERNNAKYNDDSAATALYNSRE